MFYLVFSYHILKCSNSSHRQKLLLTAINSKESSEAVLFLQFLSSYASKCTRLSTYICSWVRHLTRIRCWDTPWWRCRPACVPRGTSRRWTCRQCDRRRWLLCWAGGRGYRMRPALKIGAVKTKRPEGIIRARPTIFYSGFVRQLALLVENVTRTHGSRCKNICYCCSYNSSTPW